MDANRVDIIPDSFSFQYSLEEHVAPIVWLSYSPDGETLASCDAEGSIILWDTQSGRSRGKLQGHKDAAVSLAWCPDRSFLASGSYDQRVIIWDSQSLASFKEIYLENGQVNDLAWSPDGDILAAGYGNGSIVLFDGREFGERHTVKASPNAVYSLQFALDGSYLISSAADERVMVWDTKIWIPEKTINSDLSDIYDISLSPDGKTIATAGGGEGIAIIDTENWSRVLTLRGHTDDISCVRFSHDGELLASKSFDNTVRLWDVRSQKEIAALPEPSQNYWLSGFAWHPRRLQLASLGKGDTIIRVWNVAPLELPLEPNTSSSRGPRERPATVPVPKPPTDLVRACREGNCVVFVGAGLAAPAGMPIWNVFVERLVDWGVTHDLLKPDVAVSLREALAIGNAGQVADIVVSEIGQTAAGEARLNSYLKETFGSTNIAPPETYGLLKEIGFSAALTTNFDDLLETTFEQDQSLTPSDAEQLMIKSHTNEFFVLKLYGSIERPNTVMLSPAQYESQAAENIVFSKFMEGLFVTKTIFFVGASLEGIEVYLKALKIGSNHISRRHYAYVCVTGNAWKVKADILERRYGIKVIPYGASTDFPEVAEFLRGIQKKLQRRRDRELKGDLSAEPVAKLPVLKSATFVNIGPFDELTLKFDPNWNVLLGDNGVGKSSILKALALAFIGEEGRFFADRLIKTGRTFATITLEFEGDAKGTVFNTVITQTPSGALVQSTPAPPISVKNTLTVGFPALRTMSWDRNGDFTLAGKEILLPEDVLPLIEGKPDPRLDRLRSWFISLDHTISSPDTSETVRKRYTRLREKFFEVIRELSPGLRVEFHSIDPITKVVQVKTDDGVVPIEAVSQGTTSLLGWIGVFLQRYFDIYGHLDDKTDRYALVLIDEIDAHMHPRWQQILVCKLSKLFPNVQFIATTHSPLIIAGMPPAQLHAFARNEMGVVKKVRVFQEMTDGRADQILTNSLFGLQSTRSPEMIAKIAEYSELAVQGKSRTGEQSRRFRELSDELDTRFVGLEESKTARETYTVVADAFKEHFDKLSGGAKKQIINQMKVNFPGINFEMEEKNV